MDKKNVGKMPVIVRPGIPEWWNQHGHKAQVTHSYKEIKTLTISSTAMSVDINQHPKKKGLWRVRWRIDYSMSEMTRGEVYFSSEELESAFGLSEKSGESGNWLIERFGGDVAGQGKFIRWKDFLNLPCPGTGHDGDPNVSIFLDDKMKECVRGLLA